jgi:hypothetical protein
VNLTPEQIQNIVEQNTRGPRPTPGLFDEVDWPAVAQEINDLMDTEAKTAQAEANTTEAGGKEETKTP